MGRVRVIVNHLCGCSRPYELDGPPAVLQRVVAQLEHQECKQITCPAKRVRPQPVAGNGKGERL
jgi:hypothetical protein